VGKPEGKRPLGRPKHGWVDNIEMDLGEMGRGSYSCVCFLVPSVTTSSLK
jgi:hypothetical protein